jgi:hypothetical protein
MPSKVGREVARARAERMQRMTVAERIALAERLTADGIAAFMTTHGVDRETAIRRIKATRRLGRRPSFSADLDDH